jgi:ubiquinone/menaquinone biosynthesis C-methylase UbiE
MTWITRLLADLWWRLVHFGFRLLYHELAFTYDAVSYIVSLGAWRCWQRTALRQLTVATNGMILELAHGTGNLQIDLKTAGYRTIGYDLSPQMGRITRHKLKKLGLSAELVRGRAEQLPFVAGHFSAVVATFPTEFIVAEETLREIHRVLRDEGKLIVVLSGTFVGSGIFRSFLEWLYRITGQRPTGRRANQIAEIPVLFAEQGFDYDLIEETCPKSIVSVIVAEKRSGNR